MIFYVYTSSMFVFIYIMYRYLHESRRAHRKVYNFILYRQGQKTDLATLIIIVSVQVIQTDKENKRITD